MAGSRRTLWASIALLTLLVVGAGVLAASLPRLVEWGIPRLAARLGVPGVRVNVAHLRWGDLRLTDLHAGEGELTADSLELRFGVQSLRRGRLDRLEIAGLRVRAVLGEDGVSVAPLDDLLRGDPDAEPEPTAALPVIPLREIRLRGVHVDLQSAGDHYSVDLPDGLSLFAEGERWSLSGFSPLRVEGKDLMAAADLYLTGEVRATAGALEPDLRVEVKDFAAAREGLAIEGVNGTVRLVGLPLATPEPQRLEVDRLASGAELHDGFVVFSLEPGGALEIVESRFSTYGGTLRTRGRYDPATTEGSFRVKGAGVDMTRLLQDADVPGLTGTGRMGFGLDLDLNLAEERVRIRDGEIASKGAGGWVRYRPPGQGPLDYDAPQGLNLVRTALDDFQYTALSGSLDGDAGGDLKLALRIEGANPALYDGHPIKLDLNLNGPFLGMLRSSQTVTAIPEAIERRFQDRSQR